VFIAISVCGLAYIADTCHSLKLNRLLVANSRGLFMKNLFIAALALLAFSPFVCAQDTFQQPAPALPAEILGPPLIAWSVLQKPRPIPEPLPPPDSRDRSQSQSQSQTGQPHNSQNEDSQPQQPSAQSFTGTIARNNGKYVLKVSESTAYQIDDQEGVKGYEGKQVKIAGNLDAKNNVLHVTSIELLS
jgi:hypothetical protein